jgi:hypothetical protein
MPNSQICIWDLWPPQVSTVMNFEVALMGVPRVTDPLFANRALLDILYASVLNKMVSCVDATHASLQRR